MMIKVKGLVVGAFCFVIIVGCALWGGPVVASVLEEILGNLLVRGNITVEGYNGIFYGDGSQDYQKIIQVDAPDTPTIAYDNNLNRFRTTKGWYMDDNMVYRKRVQFLDQLYIRSQGCGIEIFPPDPTKTFKILWLRFGVDPYLNFNVPKNSWEFDPGIISNGRVQLETNFDNTDSPVLEFKTDIDAWHQKAQIQEIRGMNGNYAYLEFRVDTRRALTEPVEFINVLRLGSDKAEVLVPIILSDIPTTDPNIEGAIWNDNGMLMISDG